MFSLLDLGDNYTINIVDDDHISSNNDIDIQFYGCTVFYMIIVNRVLLKFWNW